MRKITFLDAFLATLRNKILINQLSKIGSQAVNILSTFPQSFFSCAIRV